MLYHDDEGATSPSHLNNLVHLFNEDHPACVDDDARHAPRRPHHPRSNGLAHLFDEGHPTCVDTCQPRCHPAASSTSSTRATPPASSTMHVTHVVVWLPRPPLRRGPTRLLR